MAAKPLCVTKTVLEYQGCSWWQPLNPPIWSHSCHCSGLVACCCDHGMFGKWACIDKPPCACLMFWTVQDNLQLLCKGSKALSLSWSFLVQSTLIVFIIEFVCSLCDCFLDLCLVIKQGNYCQVAYFQQQKSLSFFFFKWRQLLQSLPRSCACWHCFPMWHMCCWELTAKERQPPIIN